MENPISSINISANNVLEIRDSERIPSEFSVDTSSITVTFNDLIMSSVTAFRGERISTYYFSSYEVSVGKTTKANAKHTKEIKSLNKEIEELSSRNEELDSRNSELNNTIDSMKENIGTLTKANKELDSSNTKLTKEIDKLKADILKLTAKPASSK